MTCNDHKANIPLVLQPWNGTAEMQSWQMNLNSGTKKFTYQGSPAVGKHFRDSCYKT